MSVGRLEGRRYLVVTLADPTRSPYAECLPYLLARAGAEVELWHPGEGESAFRRIQEYRLGGERLLCAGGAGRAARQVWWMTQAALARGYDAVVVHSQVAGWVAGLVPGFLWSRPLVYQTHDFYDPRRYPARSRAEGRMLRRADLQMNGEYHRGQIYCLLHGLQQDPVITHPVLPRAAAEWTRNERTRAELAPEGEIVVTANGPYAGLRRSELLVRAAMRLGKRYRVVFTGGESEMPAGLRAEAGRQVEFRAAGFFGGVLEIARHSDVGVLLYAHNDLGNYFQSPGRLTEYLSSGLSIVYGPSAGLRYRMEEIGEGSMAREYTVEAVAAALEEAAERRDERSRRRRMELFRERLCLEEDGKETVEAMAQLRRGR